VEVVIACTVLYNYIFATNLIHDNILYEKVNIVEEQGETMDEDDEYVVTFSNLMTNREQTITRNE